MMATIRKQDACVVFGASLATWYLTPEASALLIQVRWAFASRLAQAGYRMAVAEFLTWEERALDSLEDDYPEWLDRSRIYQTAWLTDVVRH